MIEFGERTEINSATAAPVAYAHLPNRCRKTELAEHFRDLERRRLDNSPSRITNRIHSSPHFPVTIFLF
jgi:hypothetical protein